MFLFLLIISQQRDFFKKMTVAHILVKYQHQVEVPIFGVTNRSVQRHRRTVLWRFSALLRNFCVVDVVVVVVVFKYLF